MLTINLGLSAQATGTPDVITATYSPVPTLDDKKILFLRTAGSNTTTTPTFNPNALGAFPINKNGGNPLLVGDMPYTAILQYDSVNLFWDLLNPKGSELSQDVIDALFNANAPSLANPFATINDIPLGSIPTLADVLVAGAVMAGIPITSPDGLKEFILTNSKARLRHTTFIELLSPVIDWNSDAGAYLQAWLYGDTTQLWMGYGDEALRFTNGGVALEGTGIVSSRMMKLDGSGQMKSSSLAEADIAKLTDILITALTGLNIIGGSILATDTILEAFGKVQNQINGILGGATYQGVWNATTNTPALASGVGTQGYYYVVSVAGSTNLDGITDWKIGDWAIFNGTTWDKVDNTDAVSSVNGFIGAVNLTSADITEVTNLYFTEARVLATLLTGYTSGAGTITASDSVLQAIQKLNGNIALKGDAFVANPLSQFAATTSAQLAGVISDATGSGLLTFATSPTFTTDITTPLIIGGTAVGSNIIYKSTSGTGTTTAVAHQFTGGTNGGTVLSTQYNDGQFLVGTTTRILGALGVARFGLGTGTVDLGEVTAGLGAVWLSQATPSTTNYTIKAVAGGASTFNGVTQSFFTILNVTKLNLTAGSLIYTPALSSSTVPTAWLMTGAAHTGLTASAECIDANWNLARTVQHATGAIATQRSFVIQATTHSFVGASTISDAATLAITGAPVAGTNATITRSMALWVQAGIARFDGGTKRISSANNSVSENKILYGATTDAATAVELTFDGAAGSGTTNRIIVPTDTSLSIVLNIGVKQSASASAKQMLRQVVISNNGGTTAIQGTVIVLGTDSGTAGLATVTCTITANDTDDCLKVEVNGIIATSLRYTCFIVSCDTLYA